MTVEAEQTGHKTGERRGVSGVVINVLINLTRGESGDVGVAQALALAGERRSFSALGDVATWSSLTEAVALFNAAALVTGDGAIGLHVGEELLYSSGSTDFVDRLRSLGGPEAALKHIGPLIDYFETTSEAVALEVANDHALVEVSPRHAPTRQAHLCEMTRGLLAEIPGLYGLEPAIITETECSARGGRSCLYALSWDHESAGPPPDDRIEAGDTAEPHARDASHVNGKGPTPTGPPDSAPLNETGHDRRASERTAVQSHGGDVGVPSPAVAQMKTELRQMIVLLEGAFTTTLELLGDDVESLLSQIAARADAVVNAPSYLLMIRVGPGTPIQLHHRGLEPDEAQVLAAELWREQPDDVGGSRLIVDIASPRRRYGRLAAFLPPGTQHPPSEVRVLKLYAEYAAAALDIFSVLAESKRSDATARSLLSFSDALSRATDLSDSVQLLADTVPAVTGCDQSTVYLWDRESGQLVPRARTAGMASPDAFIGPIVPVRGDGRSPGGHRITPGSRRPGGTVDANGHAPRLSEVDPDDPVLLRRPTDEAAQGGVTVRTDTPLIERMVNQHEVMVLDGSTEDPFLRNLLKRSRTDASVVAPLVAAGKFLGVIAANFHAGTSTASIRDPDLHERLARLADQAATALQNLELLETVSHMAWHDALTGLPNRRLFEDRVEQELVRSRRVGEPVCMFFVDLDHFKTVNDTFGHAAGDDLIQQVSERLVDTVRSQDTVARVGGDEFAILLPGLADQWAIDQLARRTLEAIAAPFIVFGEEVVTSASIGIAIAPEHGDTYDDLLNRADAAMYRAKDQGRNAFQMFTDAGIDNPSGRPAVDDRTLYADLLHALDNHEFFVLYQPYIDLRTSQVVGVEALIRWDHPTLGILEPPSFISLAERSDVIVTLDTWVLEETCRQARIWLDHGLEPFRLSVNLASRDLSNPDFFDNIDRTLEEAGIDPSWLELEITERVVLDKLGPARDNIERLRRLGVRFTIDDFGTGNSSLNRIGSFPVSTLKIDQSFVQVLGPDGDNNALVSAIISMADRLGLACVAEGVETSLQSRVLLQRGCTTAQGFYFSPPLPPDDLERMLTNITPTDEPVDDDYETD
jgi:diguanylate cyclase (GGDEF)-like protein